MPFTFSTFQRSLFQALYCLVSNFFFCFLLKSPKIRWKALLGPVSSDNCGIFGIWVPFAWVLWKIRLIKKRQKSSFTHSCLGQMISSAGVMIPRRLRDKGNFFSKQIKAHLVLGIQVQCQSPALLRPSLFYWVWNNVIQGFFSSFCTSPAFNAPPSAIPSELNFCEMAGTGFHVLDNGNV